MTEEFDEINAKVFQDQIDKLSRDFARFKTLKENQITEHVHNGYDSSKIAFSSIDRKKVWIHHTIVGADAATAANYGVFFIAPFACYITAFKEVHQTAGTDAGAVTVTLEKLTSTQALDAGVPMLASALSLKSAINTVVSGTLTTTLADRNLAIGDRLALDDAGTLTAVANVTVMVELQITQNSL